MRYRIVRIELRDEEVLVFMKRDSSQMITAQPTNPAQLIEFSLQMGMNLVKRFEELMGFDAFITMKYEEYLAKELKVGDYVEVEIKEVE
ncbi:MAG: hypothetical protein NZ879_03785 [Archaeoglobaceae archaeon]|nr:hypothetical protein [Archaeoglobaceae archaeon]MDW8118087.1 hypothetical protein [Archaeoglobaceae archaeon]